MNDSQSASCSSAIHSFGWCACSMCPGPQMIAAISLPWNSDASVPKETLPRSCDPLQARPSSAISRRSVRIEARAGRQGIEFDMGVARHRVHFGQQRRGKTPDLGKQRIGIVERQVPELEIEAAVARHDVECRPAAYHAGVNRRVGHVVRGVESAAITEAATHLGKEGHDLAGDLHGVDAVRRQRRVHLVAAHAAAEALLALVRDDQAHPGRLTDDAARRLDSSRNDVLQQAAHADASDFLVVRQREMQRAFEPAAQELGDERESDGRKALHVGGAASV